MVLQWIAAKMNSASNHFVEGRFPMSALPGRVTIFIVLGFTALLATWGSAAQRPPAKIHIRGTITKLNLGEKQTNSVAVLLIEGPQTKDTVYDKASVKLTPQTSIKMLVGKELKDAKLADLKVGSKVEAVFIGPVAESYPVQATAGEIVIIEAAK
jgi:beta-N-acetylhexosaminidase